MGITVIWLLSRSCCSCCRLDIILVEDRLAWSCGGWAISPLSGSGLSRYFWFSRGGWSGFESFNVAAFWDCDRVSLAVGNSFCGSTFVARGKLLMREL